MTTKDIRQEFEKYTLEYYESEFADRHLLHGVIQKWAQETPDKLAIQEFDTGREYTYLEFHERSTAFALQLLQMGFEKGDFLATMLPLTAEHIFLEYACFQIGVIHAPVDLRLKAAEVIRSLEMVNAKGFVFLRKTPAIDFSEIGKEVKQNCSFVTHFLQFADESEIIDGVTSADDFISSAESLWESEKQSQGTTELGALYQDAKDSIVATDGVQVIYTTGSTGLPKPALLSHRNITSQNMCMGAAFELALSWSVIHKRFERGELGPQQEAFIRMTQEFGLVNGYTYSQLDRNSDALSVFGLCARDGLSQNEVDRIWKGRERRITSGLQLFSLAVQRLPHEEVTLGLSERQTEILRLVAEGKSVRDVAELLGLHRRTVEDHLSAARRIIGAETTMHALALAVRQGRV